MRRHSGALLSVEDLTLENAGGSTIGVRADILRDCRVVGFGIGVAQPKEIINCEISAAFIGVSSTYDTFSISDSTIRTTATDGANYAVWIGNANLTINGSTLEATGLSSVGIAHEGHGYLNIKNTELRGAASILRDFNAGPTTIAASQIAGELPVTSGSLRVVNCYDGDFNALPNQ